MRVLPLFYNARDVWQQSLGDPGALCPSFWQWQLWAFLVVLGYDAIEMLFAAWKFSTFLWLRDFLTSSVVFSTRY